MILLWGVPGDEPLMMVRRALRDLGAEVAFLDQQRVLDTEVELSVGDAVSGSLREGDDRIDLGEVTAVYLRPYESSRLPAVERAGLGSPESEHARAVEDVLVSWVEITPALVVNRPTPMAANTSKPYQAAQIRALGFAVPDTLVTTDPQAVTEFMDEHGDVIYKSVSGTRSIVARVTGEQLERLADVCWCPTQFQAYVPGVEYRAHVVGDEVFACEIRSSAVDYRYAGQQGESFELRACELPQDCAALCRRLAVAMELPVAGIDLRLAPDDTWYCFEVNPSPGFSFFQQAAGEQRIDRAIARFLVAGPS